METGNMTTRYDEDTLRDILAYLCRKTLQEARQQVRRKTGCALCQNMYPKELASKQESMTESYEEDTLCKVFLTIQHKGSSTQETWPHARVRPAVCYPHIRIQQKIMHAEKHDRELETLRALHWFMWPTGWDSGTGNYGTKLWRMLTVHILAMTRWQLLQRSSGDKSTAVVSYATVRAYYHGV